MKILRSQQNGLPRSQKADDLFLAEESGPTLINKTIVDGLKPYAVGEKLRTLRLKKSMGLVELGQHTGLSPAMLSKLERGKLFPTLPTLLRIAMVFGVGLDFFFADERKRHVVSIVRKQERLKFPENAGSSVIAYNFESLDFKASERKLNAFYAEFETGAGGKSPSPPASRGRVAVHDQRQAGTDHRLPTCTSSRRAMLFTSIRLSAIVIAAVGKNRAAQ